MMSRAASWVVVLGVCFAPAVVTHATAHRLVLRTEALASENGQVRRGLFARPDRWLGDDPTYRTTARIHDRTALCIFLRVPPGVYGATAFHDANDDGAMDRGFGGLLPREGYAISNDAHLQRRGAPSWEDARFTYDGRDMQIVARMKY